jgi:predicted dinucleotide-binding enzyme
MPAKTVMLFFRAPGGEAMKIAMIGTGRVGAVLGRRWARGGHQVVFGSRRPDADDVKGLVASAGATASAALPAEAAADADVVALATPGDVAVRAASALGDLAGKVLIDATNPILPALAGLSVGTDDSAAERIARAVPGARVVKAFNTTGSGNMDDPVYEAGRLAMFLCGDDAEAKGIATGLAEALGFEVVDCGPLESARWLEPMAMLWVTLAYGLGNGPDFGFAVLRRRSS